MRPRALITIFGIVGATAMAASSSKLKDEDTQMLADFEFYLSLDSVEEYGEEYAEDLQQKSEDEDDKKNH